MKIFGKKFLSNNKLIRKILRKVDVFDFFMLLFVIVFSLIEFIYNTRYLDLFNADESIFIIWADQILKGRGYYYVYAPPGSSLSIILGKFLTGSLLMGAKLMNTLYDMLYTIMIYLVLNELLKIYVSKQEFSKKFSKKFSLYVVIFYRGLYEVLFHARNYYTDTPFSIGFGLSFYYFLLFRKKVLFFNRSDRSKSLLHYLFLSSFWLSFATWFRWAGLWYIPWFILMIIIVYFQYNGQLNYKYREIILYSFYYFLIFILFLSPWLIYNGFSYGNPFYNEVYQNLAYNGMRGISKFNVQEYSNFLDFIHKNGLFILSKFILNMLFDLPFTFFTMRRFVLPTDLFYLIFKIISSVFFYFSWYLLFKNIFIKKLSRSQKNFLMTMNSYNKLKFILMNSPLSLLYVFFLSLWTQISLGWVIFRYLYPIYPFMLGMFFYNLYLQFYSQIKTKFLFFFNSSNSSNFKNQKSTVLFVVSLLLIWAVNLYFFVPVIRTHPYEYQEGGSILKEIGSSDDMIFALNAYYYSYYSGLQYSEYLTFEYPTTESELLEAIEKYNPDYLVISEYMDLDRIPLFAKYLNPYDNSSIPDNWELMYYNSTQSHKLLIFKI